MSHSELSDTDTLRDWKWHLICILPALGLKCSRADAANLITKMEEGWWKRLIHLLGFSKQRWINLCHHPSSFFLISPKIHMPESQKGEAKWVCQGQDPHRHPKDTFPYLTLPSFLLWHFQWVWPYGMATYPDGIGCVTQSSLTVPGRTAGMDLLVDFRNLKN